MTYFLGVLLGILGVAAIWGAVVSLMAWLTMHAWNIVLVGVLGLSRPIEFWEAFVVYLVIATIANLFRSKKA